MLPEHHNAEREPGSRGGCGGWGWDGPFSVLGSRELLERRRDAAAPWKQAVDTKEQAAIQLQKLARGGRTRRFAKELQEGRAQTSAAISGGDKSAAAAAASAHPARPTEYVAQRAERRSSLRKAAEQRRRRRRR